MKIKLLAACSALLIIILASFFFNSLKAAPPRSFQITFVRYERNNPSLKETIEQVVNSEGQSLVRRKAVDGSDDQHFIPNYSRELWRSFTSRERYEASKVVVRREQFLGLTAYVYREPIGDGMVLEAWYAPETGPIRLKEIIEYNGGASVTEATRIEFRDVLDKELIPSPHLLVR